MLDLRSITRESKRASATVWLTDIYGGERILWIRMGQVGIEKHALKRTWILRSYLAGVTDEEHDSAYALTLGGLVGLEAASVSCGVTTFDAWLSHDLDDFRVPPEGYNPAKTHGAYTCSECEEKHIVAPKHYIPEANVEAFEAFKGRRVSIEVGPVFK